MHALVALAFWLMALSGAPAQTAVEAWVQRYSNPVDSRDYALKVATDNSGNVIVAGYTDDGITDQDFLIIKYSGAGVPLWTNRYNGPVNDYDSPSAVAVDGSDNVIVTGTSTSDSSADYLTIKYSDAGVPLWTNRYNGSQRSADTATAIALDASGNVFVTGSTYGSSSAYDYATIGYSSAGVPLWTNLYNGPGNSSDYANAVAVDDSGNVFVTGHSYDTNFYADYATVAYSSAGVPLWTNRYDGPGNRDDVALAVAVNGSGNVFVTGYSARTDIGGAGLNDDYTTVAYSSAGVPLWTNRYNGTGTLTHRATAIVADSSGNVFVTGWSADIDSYSDYATVAYSGAGVPLWTNRYNGPGNDFDSSTAIAVDGNGNVFVTGFSVGSNGWDYATVAYSGAGVPLWTNRYDGTGNYDDQPHGMAVDCSGNVFVTGESWSGRSEDYATVAYSSAGVPLWTNRYDGPGNASDKANAVAVDGSSGKVFVTGSSYGDGYPNFATVAYSAAGMPLWTNRYNGPGFGDDSATALAVDGSGNVFVTGWSWGVGIPYSSYDYATVAYSGAGVPLWTNRYEGPANGEDRPNALAVDGAGNVFVTGSSATTNQPPFSFDYVTVAYSGAGVPLWTNVYDGPGNGEDKANALAVDGSGNVFVTGYSLGSGTNYDYATVAYSGGGVPLWTNRYNGPGNSRDTANAVAVDGSGNVYVTGFSGSTAIFPNNLDYATIKYSGAGVPLWTNRYNGPGNATDVAYAIALDRSGKVVVTGYSLGAGANIDYATVAYSSTGVPLWTNRYNGPGNGDDIAYAVAIDDSGNVFVTGYSARTITSPVNYDYATVAYSGAGVPLWTNRYNGPADGEDVPTVRTCLALGPNGSIYVTGASDGDYGPHINYDYATIRYSATGLLPIPLNHQIIGNQLVLNWTNAAFRLQSAPAVQGDYTDVPGATSPYNTPFSGTQRFFRLKGN